MIGQPFRIVRRKFPFGSIEFGRQLFADDRHLGRRFDANPHTTMPNLDNGDRDLISDENPLANFSTENQHVLASRADMGFSEQAACRLSAAFSAGKHASALSQEELISAQTPRMVTWVYYTD